MNNDLKENGCPKWRHNQQIYQINHSWISYIYVWLTPFLNFSHFHNFSLSFSSMAEISTLFRFRFSSPPFNSIISPSSKPLSFNNSFPLSSSSPSRPRLLRFSSKATHSSSGDDSFEFFPWSDDNSGNLFNFRFKLISFCVFIFLDFDFDFVCHTLNSKIRVLRSI